MSEAIIEELIREAQSLRWADPYRLVLGEKAVQLADNENDQLIQFETRTHLIEFAAACGAMDRALVACAWCASNPDLLRQSTSYIHYQFLWNFKHILHGAFQLPQISKAKIQEILDQMSSFHKEYGYNQRATAFLKFVIAMNMGDCEAAKKSYSRFVEIARDSMADCKACETHSRVEFLSYVKRDQEALEVATPLIKGTQSCAEVPHITYCRLLQPLIRLGKLELADKYNKTGYAKIRSNLFLHKEASIHIGFDVFRGKLSRALSRFEQRLPKLLEAVEMVERFYFFTIAGLLMEKLAEQRKTRKILFPKEFPLYNDSDQYKPAELADWFNRESQTLGAAFDQRNENDFFSNQLRSDLRFENV